MSHSGEVTARGATYDVMGLPIAVTSCAGVNALLHQWADDAVGRMVFIRDVHGVMQAFDNPALHALHQRAALITPDGMPLVWIGKARGLAVERTCGPDLMPYVIERSVASGLRHYFYGGKAGVAEQLKQVFEARFPGVNIVGRDMPPFRDMTDAEVAAVAEAIRQSDTDVVWIGISTPRQELLMERLQPLVSATLIGVGAAFDIHTGAVRRAPTWMRRSGLEWSFRLISEPRRLWRRYLIMAPRFVWLVTLDQLRGGPKGGPQDK